MAVFMPLHGKMNKTSVKFKILSMLGASEYNDVNNCPKWAHVRDILLCSKVRREEAKRNSFLFL